MNREYTTLLRLRDRVARFIVLRRSARDIRTVSEKKKAPTALKRNRCFPEGKEAWYFDQPAPQRHPSMMPNRRPPYRANIRPKRRSHWILSAIEAFGFY
jgi:hypothetical protein